jgi:hypothetical protein
MNTRIHSAHELKTLPRGFEAIQEEVKVAKLKGKSNIDTLDVLRRRVDDRRTLVRERKDRATTSLRYHFGNLLDLVSRKSE